MKLKDFFWPVFFFLLGVVSILGQTVLLREMAILFYGNELFYGLGLGTWLLLTGLGSLLATRLDLLKKTKFVWFLQSGLFFLLPLLIIVLRWLVANRVPSGETPGFGFSLSVLGTALLVFCLPLGMEFTLAASVWQKGEKKKVVNLAYLWETVGFAFAGLLFGFILATTSFPLGPKLNQETLRWRFPGLIKAENSRYHQIMTAQADTQKSFFLNGRLIFTNQESLESQQLISLITPFVQRSQAVLLLTSPNLSREINTQLKPQDIDFLEIDPKFFGLEKELLVEDANPVLADPRRLLSQTKMQWDLIIFSPGNPETILTNRYFTKECFQQIKNHLSPDGVFALLLYLPTSYQSEEAARFGSSVYHTLKAVFPTLELLTPEDQLLFLSSKKELKIFESQVNPVWNDYFWYQIKNPKRDEILKQLAQTPAVINTDLEPVAFFYHQLFWQTIFSFKIPKLIFQSETILPWLGLVLFLITLFKGGREIRLGILAASSSFVLLSLEILILFIFQAKIGYLYSQISIIFAAVLSGMALGVKKAETLKNPLRNLRCGFGGYLLILALFLLSLSQNVSEWPVFWFGIACLSGFLGGLVFAQINNLYLKKRLNPGYIYAFDLFGGSLGAFLTSGLLLPILGVKRLIGSLVTIILASLLAIIYSRQLITSEI